MRVAHFCDSQAGRPDGVARSAALTVSLLRAAGHHVDFLRPGSLSLPLPFRQVRVAVALRPPPVRPDLVHVHSTGPVGMAGFRWAARWRVPLVLSWHTDLLAYADTYPEIPVGAAWCALQLRLGWSAREFAELTRPGAVRRGRLVALGRAMFARVTVAIAPSAKTAEGFAAFAPLPEVCVLPTPVWPVAPRSPGNRGDVVLAVGRATAEKNPELLLRAFGRLRDAKPRARLIMLGVRLGRRRLEHRIAALGLAGHVEVLPPVPPGAVAGYYRAADVLAFASTTDTQSLVLAEAEAAGLPVVLADRRLAARPDGGPDRCATDPDPAAFSAGLLRMLDDPALRAATVRAGLAATAAYPPALFRARLIDIYRRHL